MLLLHGWGDSSSGLAVLNKELSKKYKVVALDLPGFGKSEGPKTAWDLDNYSEFLRLLLKKLELNDLYAVIGHSNGGAVALRAISLRKLEPKKLILIAASGIRSGQKLKRLTLTIIAKTGNIATLWMPEKYRRILRQSLYGVAGSDMLVAPELVETFKKSVRQDVQKDAANINIPTLLIYAKEDKAVPLHIGKQYSQLIKDSKLEKIDNSGHFIHIDQPEITLKLIEDFLS